MHSVKVHISHYARCMCTCLDVQTGTNQYSVPISLVIRPPTIYNVTVHIASDLLSFYKKNPQNCITSQGVIILIS